MSLENALPLSAFPGFTWSSVVSDQVQEIITTINTEGLGALSAAPEKAVAWAGVGTRVSTGVGVVKVPVRLPDSTAFQPFTYGGRREYQNIDVGAAVVRANPWALNFRWPMIWDMIGNNMQLMSQQADGSLVPFMGAAGIANDIVFGARFQKAQLVASLFYKSLTDAGIGLTAEAFTLPQPGFPNGLPLFTNGTDSALHFANPFRATSGRFQTLYPAYGTFDAMYVASLVEMTQVPHPTLPNMFMGLEATDVLGPSWMRDRFYAKAVQQLALQVQSIGINAVGAATSNIMNVETLARYNANQFIGASNFAPQRFWICSALDSHPYFTANGGANLTTGPGGGPADMWVTIAANKPGLCWAELVAPTKEFTPRMYLFGDGDPQSIEQRAVRLLGDLDAGAAAGLPHGVKMFLGV